jgi:hypothetical protein
MLAFAVAFRSRAPDPLSAQFDAVEHRAGLDGVTLESDR